MSDFECSDVSTGPVSVKAEKKRFRSADDIKAWLRRNGEGVSEFLKFGPDDNRLVKWSVIEKGLITGGGDMFKIGFPYLDRFSLEFRGDTPEEMIGRFLECSSDECKLTIGILLDISDETNTHEIWTRDDYAGVYVDYILDVVKKLREGLSEYL